MLRTDLRALEPDLTTPDEGHRDPRSALSDLVAALATRGIESGSACPSDFSGPVIDARGIAAAASGLRGAGGALMQINAQHPFNR